MKKLFSLAVVAAVLAVSVGCDDKAKTSPPKPSMGSGSGTATSGSVSPK